MLGKILKINGKEPGATDTSRSRTKLTRFIDKRELAAIVLAISS